MDLGITGRRAAVAAASDGLGYASAVALTAEGALVAICGRDRVASRRPHHESGAAAYHWCATSHPQRERGVRRGGDEARRCRHRRGQLGRAATGGTFPFASTDVTLYAPALDLTPRRSGDFLCGDHAKFVAGVQLHVDGGSYTGLQ